MTRGLAKLLKLLNHEVWTAYDGPTGLEVARAHCPEVLLLDIGLPGMDGYQVAKQLRREEYGKDVLLIAVTGYGQEEDRQRAALRRLRSFRDQTRRLRHPPGAHGGSGLVGPLI